MTHQPPAKPPAAALASLTELSIGELIWYGCDTCDATSTIQAQTRRATTLLVQHAPSCSNSRPGSSPVIVISHEAADQ